MRWSKTTTLLALSCIGVWCGHRQLAHGGALLQRDWEQQPFDPAQLPAAGAARALCQGLPGAQPANGEAARSATTRLAPTLWLSACAPCCQGVFHVEGKYTSRGARLIEVNCRMGGCAVALRRWAVPRAPWAALSVALPSPAPPPPTCAGGGPVRTMNKLCWGVDLVEEQLLCSAGDAGAAPRPVPATLAPASARPLASCTGIPSRPPVAPKPLMNIAEFSVNAKKSGVQRDLTFLDKNQDMPGVLYARPLVDAGSSVVCVEDGLPTWVCELMVTKPDIHEAIEFVKAIEQEIQAAMPIDAK